MIYKILLSAICLSFLVYGQESKYYGANVMLADILQKGANAITNTIRQDMMISKIDVDLVDGKSPAIVIKALSSKYDYIIHCIGAAVIKNVNMVVSRKVNGKTRIIASDDSQEAPAAVVLNNPTDDLYYIEISAEMQEGEENSIGYFYLLVSHD